MKTFLLQGILILLVSYASAQSSPAVELANKIADKMKDSLNLMQSQRQQIFVINVHLADQKKAVFKKYQNRDSVGKYLQLIENSRDSLYREVIDQPKYDQYKQQKKHLITNN